MLDRSSKDISSKPETSEEFAQLLRSGLDVLRFGFGVFDNDLSLVVCNRAFFGLRGYPASLCKPGTHISELYRFNAERGDYGPGDVETHVRSRLYQASKREPYELEYELATGRVLSIQYTPIPNCGVLLSYADVTERKRAGARLAEKEAQLRLALTHAPGGMVVWDRSLNYVLMNPQYAQLHDFPDNIVKVGGSLRDEACYQASRGDFGQGDSNELVENVLAVYQKGEPGSWERTIPGGRTLQVNVAPTPEDGYVSIVTDITKLKHAEEALASAKRKVEESNKRIVEQNRTLEELSVKLSKYLSPQVYSSIFSGDQKAEIASQRKKLTVLFSDIADFTEATESLESEELTSLLNRYLTEMSKIALDYGATIDKYVGDAIMLFFGDPETKGVKQDAEACVAMAIAMQRRMHELQQEWKSEGLEQPFELRIGINTGYCTVGNFGSEDRMDYTIIGNEVNLTARLQSHAERGGILMTHETYSLVEQLVSVAEQTPLSVKGFSKPIRTYKVAGLYDDLIEEGCLVRLERNGLKLTIDRSKLSKEDRRKAASALENIASQLRS